MMKRRAIEMLLSTVIHRVHELFSAIAEKQLYSSHYFETALDLSVCISDADTGFYLIKVMGSEQKGLPRVALIDSQVLFESCGCAAEFS